MMIAILFWIVCGLAGICNNIDGSSYEGDWKDDGKHGLGKEGINKRFICFSKQKWAILS